MGDIPSSETSVTRETSRSPDTAAIRDALAALDLNACEQGVLLEAAYGGGEDRASRGDLSPRERADATHSLADAELIEMSPGGVVTASSNLTAKVEALALARRASRSLLQADSREALYRSIVQRMVRPPAPLGDVATIEAEFSQLSFRSAILVNAYPDGTQDFDAEVAADDLALCATRKAAGQTTAELVSTARLGVSAERQYFAELAEIHSVRVTDVPLRLALIDAETAVLQRDPHDHRQGALVTRDRDAVAYVGLLLSQLMARAVPLQRKTPVVLTPRQRAIVTLLAAGLTDEAIARRTGVTDRTVRRSIAELLEMFDVSSRFALGVEAAKQGVI